MKPQLKTEALFNVCILKVKAKDIYYRNKINAKLKDTLNDKCIHCLLPHPIPALAQ